MQQSQRSDVPSPGSDGLLRLRVDLFDRRMKARGITTVADQAREAGVGRATLFRIRAGACRMSARTAIKLVNASGSSLDKLFERVAS